MRIRASLVCLFFAAPATAQSPLSAIDWLDNPSQVIAPTAAPAALPLPNAVKEAPVSTSASVPDVAVQPLGAQTLVSSVGLLPSRVTGLPETLWKKSSSSDIEALIQKLDARDIPAIQELFYTLLLAEAEPPQGADPEIFLTQRATRLAAFGAIEPAAELLAQLPLKSARHFDLLFDLTLYAGLEDKACDALNGARALTNDYAAQIFCSMRGGAWEEASLLFESANALNLLSASERRLLQAFLDPDYAELAPSLAPPRNISPLEFRLYEAVGNPLPTPSLPLSFAVSDLRDLAGWKAQLEAAERLARVEAVSANELLGLYTSRKPSASGGVWERARAVQTLDAALTHPDPEALGAALLAGHKALAEVHLEQALAEIYVPELAQANLQAKLKGAAATLAFEMALMTKAYEEAKPPANGASARNAFLTSLAQGAPVGAQALNSQLALAVEAGFTPATTLPQTRLTELMSQAHLGEAILTAMGGMVRGLEGDYTALTDSLRALRQMGLEDVSRRAALQMLLRKS